jgi:hypothetical protein
MTYEAKLTVKFDSTFTHSPYSSYETDTLPEEHVTFEIPVHDLTTTQLFGLFKKVMLTMGYCEQSIASGVMSTVFNPDGDEKLMRKMCEEYDLTMNEDVAKKVQEEVKKQLEIEKELNSKKGPMGTLCKDWEEHFYPEEAKKYSNVEESTNIHATPGSYRKLYQENLDLKAKLSRLKNPDSPSYTDEEIEAMSYEDSVEKEYLGKIHDDGVS